MVKKKRNIGFFLGLFILLVIPVSFLMNTKFVNFDTVSAVIFLLIVLYLVIRYKKNLDFQPVLQIAKMPIIYAVLWKTKFGLKFMDKVSSKYRELVKLIGYSFIGFAFFGLIFISINILWLLVQLFLKPQEASQGIALVLPFTHIPGIGFLSFWHFLITIFITVLVHEFAHGIVARAHNVPVKSSGLGVFGLILPIFPLAFVEPDEKKLQKDKDIVQYSIFAAGPMVNVILAFIILLLMNFAITPLEDNITHPIGFSFSQQMDNYSAQEAGLMPGMIINEVDGVETLDYQSFSKEIGELKPDETLEIGTLNGSFSIVTKPSPDNPDNGYIGILNIYNERRINDDFKAFGGAFFWFKGLFKWLYFINLAIGLMNLLPLLITDGGRMLKTALEKIFGNAKKADKVWVFIGAIFIFTLLFALVVKYSLSLFSVLGFS